MRAILMPLEAGVPIPLEKPIIFIGRHPDCDVVLARSRKVSRKHCCIAQVNERLMVRDLGSTNGVLVNGTRVTREATIRPGDEVIIGDVGYRVENGISVEGRQDAVRQGGASARPPRNGEGEAKRRSPVPPPAISQEYPVLIDEDGGDEPRNAEPAPSDELEIVEFESVDDDDVIPLRSDSDAGRPRV